MFLNKVFYREELLAPRPTPKLEDHPLSAVRDCLFNLFAATLLIGGRSSISNTRTRHAVVSGIHYCYYSSDLIIDKIPPFCSRNQSLQLPISVYSLYQELSSMHSKPQRCTTSANHYSINCYQKVSLHVANALILRLPVCYSAPYCEA